MRSHRNDRKVLSRDLPERKRISWRACVDPDRHTRLVAGNGLWRFRKLPHPKYVGMAASRASLSRPDNRSIQSAVIAAAYTRRAVIIFFRAFWFREEVPVG